ncbi:hypothetical protein D5S17_21905 [Pseudonocardiaceae bacterium YIM PH 21723]|nr:hypothetical protein D5S17_21905 [Pseudonocardiaceae bacterium YIM PH 21723]
MSRKHQRLAAAVLGGVLLTGLFAPLASAAPAAAHVAEQSEHRLAVLPTDAIPVAAGNWTFGSLGQRSTTIVQMVRR